MEAIYVEIDIICPENANILSKLLIFCQTNQPILLLGQAFEAL